MKKYEKLLIDYRISLHFLREDIEEYAKNPTPETTYYITQALTDLPATRRALIKRLPKGKREEVLKELEKEELEVIRMLEKVDKDGARILAEELQDVLSLTEERE